MTTINIKYNVFLGVAEKNPFTFTMYSEKSTDKKKIL